MKRNFKGLVEDHCEELGLKNTIDKIQKIQQYQLKRMEIKEANKKNKILKYLREQTIEKENEQRNNKNKDSRMENSKDEIEEGPSRQISGVENLNLGVNESGKKDKNALDALYKERKRFRYYYNTCSVILQGMVSIFALYVFFFSLYIKRGKNSQKNKDILYIMEVVVSGLILLDLINSFILKREKVKFFKNILNWTDFVTVVPILLTFIIKKNETYYGDGFFDFWQIWRNLRFFRIYKIIQKFGNINDLKYLASISSANDKEIKFRLSNIIIHILSFVIISASLMMSFQELAVDIFEIGISYETDFTFDAALYYVIITITTVGYGDMSPKTSVARIIICFFFIIAIIFITKQTTDLSDLLTQNNLAYRMAIKSKSVKHVILTSSSLNLLKLFRFVREFFHKDHDIQESIKAVVICSEPPSYDTVQALSDFEDNLHFIVGSIFEKDTLMKADVANADAAFIISNQYDDSSMK